MRKEEGLSSAALTPLRHAEGEAWNGNFTKRPKMREAVEG